jgi:hypothetical protein
MHKQLRVVAISSPPDIEKLLGRLKDAGINLAGVGGGNVEFGGEFAFAVHHGEEDGAEGVLKQHGYPYRKFDHDENPELTLCPLKDEVGSLHACIARVSEENLKRGRIIRDVLVGMDDEVGLAAQVFSEEVRTPVTIEGGATGS